MLKLTELFSGIGAQTTSLKRLNIAHKSVACEVKPWIHSIYESIHGPTMNLGDITKVESLPDTDVLTYSFPCQDLSALGKCKGLVEGSGTRSSLLWEVKRLLQEMKDTKRLPHVLLLENVKQLVNRKNLPEFNKWISFLSSLGYVTTWKVLNARDFGVPQNRERVFAVSVMDDSVGFIFPTEKNKYVPLSDFMDPENKVVSEFGIGLFAKDEGMLTKIWKTVNNTQCINATNRIYCVNSVVHALTCQGSHPGNYGAVLYAWDVDVECPLRNIVKGTPLNNLKDTLDDIRLATPREYFRLMGFNDEEFDSAKFWCKKNNKSFSNLYHVAGNSIVVNILVEIFRELHNQRFI